MFWESLKKDLIINSKILTDSNKSEKMLEGQCWGQSINKVWNLEQKFGQTLNSGSSII